MKIRNNGVAVILVALLAVTLSGCSSANKAVEETGQGGLDLSQQLMGAFGDAGSILGSITGTDSAEKAVPELDSLNASLGDLAKAAGEASPEVQSSLSDIAASQIPGFTAITEKVYAIPGVKPVVKPQVDGLLAKFAGF